MRGFLIGLAVGTLGVYAALKLVDKETREEWLDKADKMKDKVSEEWDHTMTIGKRKGLRARVRAKQGMESGKKKLNQVAGDVAGKLGDVADKVSSELADLEAKAKANV